MVLLTLAASAVTGSAQRRHDEDIQTMAHSTAALSGFERFYRSDLPLWDWRQSQAICDGQHCDIGTSTSPAGTQGLGDDRSAAGAGAGGDDLTAALWLFQEPMYVPDVGVGAVDEGGLGVPGARLDEVQSAVEYSRVSDWRTLIEQWHDWDVSTMLRIIDCESHGDANAVSPPDYDGIANYGGLQLHGDPGGLDPVYAVQEAHRKWLTQGYHAWGCY